MTENKELYGCIPSPDDERDYPCCMAMEVEEGEALPDEFEVWTPPLEDQGRTGNCVAQALAAIIESEYHKQKGGHEDYSVGYIYGNRIKSGRLGSGLVVRSAADLVVEDGDVLREVWECLDEVPDVISAFNEVYDGIKGKAWCPFSEYVRISNFDELRRFIYKYGIPVIVRVDAGDIAPLNSGWHAVIVYGWDANGRVKIQNSWGDYCGRIVRSFKILEEIWGLVPMEKTFTDIEDEAWYAQAVKEAAADGIINGYPDGSFKPEKPVSRAEAAAIFLRIKTLLAKK